MSLARELKIWWKLKVTGMPIIIGILGTISKSLRDWKPKEESRPSRSERRDCQPNNKRMQLTGTVKVQVQARLYG